MREANPKEYTLYSNAYFIIFIWVVPTILTLVAGLFFYFGLAHRTPDGPPLFVAVFPLAAAAWAWWRHVRMPQRIVVQSDGRIEFVGPLLRVTLTPRDIVSIKPDRRQFGFLIVKHEAGTFRLLNQFNGFHELLTYIEATNPGVEMRGC
jgi:hypothetical protein